MLRSGLFDFPRTREESRQRRRPYSRVTFTLLLANQILEASAACILLMVPCFTRRDSTSTSFPARISSTFLASTASFSFCMAPSRAFCSTSREEILARASCSAWLTKVLALAPCLFSQGLARGPGLRFGVFNIHLVLFPVLTRHGNGSRASGGGMTLLEAFKPGLGASGAVPGMGIITGGTSGFQRA